MAVVLLQPILLLQFANSTLAIVINSNSPVCSGDALQLTGPALVGANFSWTGPAGYTSIVQSPLINGITAAGAGSYTLDVVDANGCTGTASLNVVVNPLPVSNATNTGPFCEGSTIQLNSGGGNSYSWTGPGGISLSQNPTINSSTITMGGIYTVVVSDANNCTNSSTTNVVVNAGTCWECY